MHLAVLLRDAELATGLRDPEALPHFHLDRAQRSDDLCCRLSVPCHTPSFRQPEILTSDLTWFKGGRSRAWIKISIVERLAAVSMEHQLIEKSVI